MTCHTCEGSGFLPDQPDWPCGDCAGTGDRAFWAGYQAWRQDAGLWPTAAAVSRLREMAGKWQAVGVVVTAG
jgi:hypothetical protein